jgi:hypothetical protein
MTASIIKNQPPKPNLYIAMTTPSFPLTILPANTTHLYFSFYLLPSPVKLSHLLLRSKLKKVLARLSQTSTQLSS